MTGNAAKGGGGCTIWSGVAFMMAAIFSAFAISRRKEFRR
jgi:hypothetical protein